MAQQLNAYDEASMTALWEKYATIVEKFEPSKRWEEAALIFSLIQAVRMKNQLFNQNLAASVELSEDRNLPGLDHAVAWLEKRKRDTASTAQETPSESGTVGESKPLKRRKVLSFGVRKGDKPV